MTGDNLQLETMRNLHKTNKIFRNRLRKGKSESSKLNINRQSSTRNITYIAPPIRGLFNDLFIFYILTFTLTLYSFVYS